MKNEKQKLNQVIAVEKGVKGRVTTEVTKLYHTAQKPSLFNGFTKTFVRRRDDAEQQPTQAQRVQYKTSSVLRDVSAFLSELFDITAAKDYANCAAKANVVVDGVTLLKDAPATYLLFLEKQLTDLHTSIAALPTLDPAEEWIYDAAVELWKTKPTETVSTKKVQKPLVLIPPTDKHPGQAQIITEDETVGTWEHVKMSGALTEDRRRVLLERIEKLQRSVKYAREEANNTVAPPLEVGKTVFDWLFSA